MSRRWLDPANRTELVDAVTSDGSDIVIVIDQASSMPDAAWAEVRRLLDWKLHAIMQGPWHA